MPFPVVMYTIKNEDTNLSVAKHIKYCDKKEEPNHRHSNSQRSPPTKRNRSDIVCCLLNHQSQQSNFSTKNNSSKTAEKSAAGQIESFHAKKKKSIGFYYRLTHDSHLIKTVWLETRWLLFVEARNFELKSHSVDQYFYFKNRPIHGILSLAGKRGNDTIKTLLPTHRNLSSFARRNTTQIA